MFKYKFAAVPHDRDPRWFELGLIARMLACELFHASGCHIHDDGDPVIPVGDDWKVSLCRSLCIDGKDRGNVCRALERAREAGLLDVQPGFVRVLFRPRSGAGPLTVRAQSARTPQRLRLESSTENHSTPVLQIEEKRSEEIEEADARVRTRELSANFASSSAAAADFDPTRAEASRGRTRLRAISELQLDFDHGGKWMRPLAQIARYPDAEWAIAAATIAQVVSTKRGRGFVTPQHVVDYWQAYSAGEEPGKRVAQEPTRIDFKAARVAEKQIADEARRQAVRDGFKPDLAKAKDSYDREMINHRMGDALRRLESLL